MAASAASAANAASMAARVASAGARVAAIDPGLLREGISIENGGIRDDLRLACIASELISLERGVVKRVKINGLRTPITIELETFNYRKLNKENGSIGIFKDYSFSSEIIRKLSFIRKVIQKKNNKSNPTRYPYTENYCALAMQHCRSEPGKIGKLATGCIISTELSKNKRKATLSMETATASGEAEVPIEQGLMVRGHGKFINNALWITDKRITDELSKNVHYRADINHRSRNLDKIVDIEYYVNWVLCAIKLPHYYSNRKTDDLIQVKYIDVLDMYGECDPGIETEGSFSASTARYYLNTRVTRHLTLPYGSKRRRTNNQSIPEAAEETPKSINIGGTVKRKRPKRRKRKTRKR